LCIAPSVFTPISRPDQGSYVFPLLLDPLLISPSMAFFSDELKAESSFSFSQVRTFREYDALLLCAALFWFAASAVLFLEVRIFPFYTRLENFLLLASGAYPASGKRSLLSCSGTIPNCQASSLFSFRVVTLWSRKTKGFEIISLFGMTFPFSSMRFPAYALSMRENSPARSSIELSLRT